jgi:TolB-like protein/Flp pilus assembly protein TadD
MKRCPECRRDYYDDSLRFCLDDGTALFEGPSRENEAPTAIIPGIEIATSRPSPAESLTRTQTIHTSATDAEPERTFGASTHQSRSSSNRSAAAPLIRVGAVIAILVAVFLGYRYLYSIPGEKVSSIAVLPFENLSGNADTDYLSDGLTDSLIFRFSQLPDLKVSPTSSVMQYKGKTVDVARIAKELDVNAVLTGRLIQLGDSLDISVQLIDARTGKLIWAEQYGRKMSDLLATQREIAITLTQKMQLKLAGNEQGIAKKYTSSNEAYQLYMKGRFHWARRSKEDLLKAVDSYKKAIELDANFALAYAGIAESYNSLAKNPHLAPKDSVPFAKAAAERALEIDDTLPQAHSAMADALAIYEWDWAGSEEHFKKAIEIDPNISYIHLVYGGSLLSALGRADDALKHEQRAVELEPLSLINNAVLVSGYINARQPEKALEQASATFELDRSFVLSRHWLGFALIANGKNEEAVELCRTAETDPSGAWLSTVVRAHAYAKMGRPAEAEKEIGRLREAGKNQYIRSYYLASIYATLGDKDKAFAELERAIGERDCYLGRVRVDPFMDPIRDDPRFKDLAKRMNLPE